MKYNVDFKILLKYIQCKSHTFFINSMFYFIIYYSIYNNMPK